MSDLATKPDIDQRDRLPWMRDAKGLVPEHFHTFKAVNGRLTCACGETCDDRDARFWDTHCWAKRFDGEACAAPAVWQGPQDSPSSFVRAWRACAIHRQASDVRWERISEGSSVRA